MAAEAMQRLEYPVSDIHFVRTAIADTRLAEDSCARVQTPSIELSGYLLDADLANLGRADFFERMDLLCRETKRNKVEEMAHAKQLLEHHQWCTSLAHAMLQEGKEENLRLLREKLNSTTAEG